MEEYPIFLSAKDSLRGACPPCRRADGRGARKRCYHTALSNGKKEGEEEEEEGEEGKFGQRQIIDSSRMQVAVRAVAVDSVHFWDGMAAAADGVGVSVDEREAVEVKSVGRGGGREGVTEVGTLKPTVFVLAPTDPEFESVVVHRWGHVNNSSFCQRKPWNQFLGNDEVFHPFRGCRHPRELGQNGTTWPSRFRICMREREREQPPPNRRLTFVRGRARAARGFLFSPCRRFPVRGI